MKIRTGFVSNSSSSSFCIYGIYFDDGEGEKLFNNLKENTSVHADLFKLAHSKWEQDKEKWEKRLSPEEIALGKEFYKTEPTIEDILEYNEDNAWEVISDLMGMEHHSMSDYGGHYLGRAWDAIDDDETGRQFKDGIEQTLTKYFGPDQKCSTHEEAWYNG